MTLNVSLTPQLEAMIHGKVKSGKYNSASEVVREALRLLEDRDALRALQLEKLRKEVQKGIDSGPGKPMEEVLDRLERKYLAMADNHKQ